MKRRWRVVLLRHKGEILSTVEAPDVAAAKAAAAIQFGLDEIQRGRIMVQELRSSADDPRGKYLGERVGDPPKDEGEHFVRCPACDGWIDCRDLSQVFEHEGPLPHPAQDQPQ